MEDFETEATRYIMQIRTNVQNNNTLSLEAIDSILGSCLYQIKEIKKLERQLDYALETGGKYLNIDDIVS